MEDLINRNERIDSFGSYIKNPIFTEWKNIESLNIDENRERKIAKGKVAIVLKTEMCTWYCGYKKKEYSREKYSLLLKKIDQAHLSGLNVQRK